MAAAVLHAMPGDLSETVRGEFPPVATRPRGRAREARRLRRLRYWLRTVAQDLSSAKGIVRCGRRRTFAPGGQGTVEIRLNSETGAAYFAGLLRCGSVWECPVCMHRIQYERAKELRAVLAANRDRQGAAYMLTLTLPHDQGDDHRAMRRHVARAWRYVQTGAPWRRLTRRLALVGSCRALETTHGPHGWHPHLHVLLVLRAGLDAEVQRELLALVRRRWTDAITRPNPDGGKQYRPPSLEHGVTLTVSHEDDYLAKLGLADELAGAAVKRAAADHRTPLEILVGAARRDPRDRALWVEYARDMRGARKLTWGGSLGTPAGRAAWGLAPDQPDLALAGAEERGPALVVAELEGKVWDTLVLGDVRLQLRLLRCAEDLPPPEARDRIARALLWAAGEELPPF